jgi:DNA-binding NarL/FixJ family response regulator
VDISGTGDDLEGGRESYAKSAWLPAHESLARADELEALAAPDLELFATSAYMLGREDEWLKLMERACHLRAEAGEQTLAARCAFWIGMHLFLRGQMGPGTGWLGRAGRLLEGEGDCVEQGYMLMPVMFQHEAEGDFDGAAATAAAAAEIGERFADRDLFSLAMFGQGDILVHHGRVREGLALLDQAMVGATTGELSPIATGIVYCGVIMTCEEVHDVRRAREWTEALRRWWEQQPDLMAFTGRCLVHRAQLMQLQGAWPEALEEADRADRRFERAANPPAAAKSAYLQGEVYRLRGDVAAAEEAYRRASQHGLEPQPGWSLLRLAQGKADAAATAIRRVLGETTDSLPRGGLLPAYVEIMLRVGELEEARAGVQELTQIADDCDSDLLRASAAQARGAVELAAGEATRALASLRQAAQAWQELEAPYEAARVRVLVGRACRELGDDEAFALELESARSTFEQLGAAPDLAAVGALDGGAAETHGLSARELQVLRLIASGKGNREIASALVISEHTVARHVQNIFVKLRVTSRTAAGAFAFQHDLV